MTIYFTTPKYKQKRDLIVFNILLFVVFTSLFIFFSCTNEEDKTEPLAGNWILDSLNIHELYIFPKDTIINSNRFYSGDTAFSRILTWEILDSLGVQGSILLRDDNSFKLSGYFPRDNDTIGRLPSVIAFEDFGTWSISEDYSTFSLNGLQGPISGNILIDDIENPLNIVWEYANMDTITTKILRLTLNDTAIFVHTKLIQNKKSILSLSIDQE